MSFEPISVHTKVRRLRYISNIAELLVHRQYIPVNLFSQEVETLLGNYNYTKSLDAYVSNKGIITESKKGGSAKPYVDACNKLWLLAEANRSYIPSKQGRSFIEIRKMLEVTSEVSFELNIWEKFYLLRQIIKHDYLYFFLVLESTVTTNGTTLKEIKISLKEKIYALIRENIEVSINFDEKKQLQDLLMDFANDKLQKERSFESLVEPRLHWQLDLGLLDENAFKEKKYKASEAGKNIVSFLKGQWLSLDTLLENSFFKRTSQSYNIAFEEGVFFDEPFFVGLLSDAFGKFKTLAPNSISASQAFDYISFLALFRFGKLMEFAQTKQYFLKGGFAGVSLNWFKSKNEGSLDKIK